jgi:hypothetical protein
LHNLVLAKREGSGMDLHCPLIGEREGSWAPREGIVIIVPPVFKGSDLLQTYEGFVNLARDLVKFMNDSLLIFLAHF